MEVSRSGNILICFKGDTKNIYEYRSGKEVKAHPVDGQKKVNVALRRLLNNLKTTISSLLPSRKRIKRMRKAQINTLSRFSILLINTSLSLKHTLKYRPYLQTIKQSL
jgi:hypothetical protein